MSDETRKQGSVLPLGESLAGFLCSDGVFRVKSGEFRRATVGEWWQDKANGRVYCVNSEYPQDILAEPDLPAPSHTEGGGPDDTKQVSKEQGASPSVTPAVTTDGVPVVREGREESRFCEPGVCPCCDAPSVVSGGEQNEARIEAVAPDLFAQAVAQGMNAPFALDCDYWGREYTERLIAAAPFLVSASDESATRDRVLAAIKETIDLHGAPPLAPTPDLEPSYSTLYRLVVAALDKKGQDDG